MHNIDGEKIRLACIDTPELKGKKANPTEAKRARDFLNQLVSNKKFQLEELPRIDSEGQLLNYLKMISIFKNLLLKRI